MVRKSEKRVSKFGLIARTHEPAVAGPAVRSPLFGDECVCMCVFMLACSFVLCWLRMCASA
eukprot:2152600-Pleurochrysis_carterae.AAC.1